ncbi:hypothetical protein [Novosphingobium pentaromativorans]|uniref:Bacteriophage tail tape measure C-terminal domain-containing protein n=1 Tax=Novosphingobium pentaromativorans US6-1 TaxID=1088721 RepID=G6E7K7_9SPHN|nr:hypothetical protein [Novosphingobium pentaromativorans]AIT81594.1 hypothetical protein JI59_18375 [Novosphingobium pentaromativorans US6-1]EHJ62830.1 hypothetical protein NSU_0342 [Novosphingobium pentaromativorans US6-1]
MDPLELIAVEVRADLDQLEKEMTGATRVVDANAAKITNSVERSERAIVQSARNSGQAMQGTGRNASMLGAQFSQMGQQVAAGSSPFQALAIQLPDIAYLLGNTGSEAGKLATFFGGPWGIALTTAVAVLAPLVERLIDTEDALDRVGDAAQDAMDKLRASLNTTSVASNAADEVTKKLVGNLGELAKTNRDIAQTQNLLEDAARSAGGGNSLEILNNRLVRLNSEKERINADIQQSRKDLKQIASDAQVAQMQAEARARQSQTPTRTPSPRSSSSSGRGARSSRVDTTPVKESLDDVIAQAQQDMLVAFADAFQKQSDADWDDFREQVRRMEEFRAQERERTDARLHYQQEQQVRSLASIYEDAFRGGTSAIWADFKAIGLRVIAEVLARFTIAKIGGGEFSLGGALTSAISSAIPGFASGGSLSIGGRGGIDKNVLSLNGSPIAKVSNGETLHVTNPSLSRGGGAPAQINQTFVLDARGGITTPELLQYVNDTASAKAAQAAGAMGQAVMRGIPSRLSSFQRDGT